MPKPNTLKKPRFPTIYHAWLEPHICAFSFEKILDVGLLLTPENSELLPPGQLRYPFQVLPAHNLVRMPLSLFNGALFLSDITAGGSPEQLRAGGGGGAGEQRRRRLRPPLPPLRRRREEQAGGQPTLHPHRTPGARARKERSPISLRPLTLVTRLTRRAWTGRVWRIWGLPAVAPASSGPRLLSLIEPRGGPQWTWMGPDEAPAAPLCGGRSCAGLAPSFLSPNHHSRRHI